MKWNKYKKQTIILDSNKLFSIFQWNAIFLFDFDNDMRETDTSWHYARSIRIKAKNNNS